MRIVSICPSNTEVVGYLGKADMLVAVDDYSNWPDEVADLPRVGPDLAIDMDKVESLGPDLVLASLSVPGMEKNIYELNKRGIPHITLNPNSLEDIAKDIETVGEALHCKETGAEKARTFRESVHRYRKFADEKVEKPSLYWEWWPKPVFTPGRANWLTEISELAGAYNVFATEPEANVQSDWEDVLKRNPDHICLVWVGVDEEKVNPGLLMKRPGWKEMKAVQNQSVHILGDSLYCRPSPRLLLGLDKLIHTLWGQSPPR